jgi:hypothetical protein
MNIVRGVLIFLLTVSNAASAHSTATMESIYRGSRAAYQMVNFHVPGKLNAPTEDEKEVMRRVLAYEEACEDKAVLATRKIRDQKQHDKAVEQSLHYCYLLAH